jgi:capsular exopolysaccharide synthesis family protein
MNSNNNPQQFLNNEEDEISLIDIVFIFKRHQRKIIWATIIVFFFTFLYTFWVKPVYESTGMILIEDSSSALDIFDMGMGAGKNYLENEIEILKSRTTAELTITKLLNSKHRNNLFFFGTRPYSPDGINKVIRNMLTFGLIDKIEDKATLNPSISDSLFSEFTKLFMEELVISNTRNTDVLSISMKSIDPVEASLLVNMVIDVYKSIDLEWAKGEMSHLKSFLLEQLDKKEIELSETENLLKQFQENEKIFGVDENSKFLLENLINTESQLYKSKAERNILNERIKYIKSQLTDEEMKLTDRVLNTINDRLFALKKEVAIKETELVSAIAQQGESHNIVKTLRGKLDRLKKNLEKETRQLISQGISVADPIRFRQALMDSVISITAISAGYESKIHEFTKLVSEYENQLGELPEKVLEYTRLERNLNIHAETYSLMRQKLEEARINEASQIGKVRVIDKAYPNNERIKPQKKINLIIGLILGLGLGVSIAFILEYMDNTIKSIDEVDRRNLSILALIPSIGRGYSDKNKRTKKYQKKLGNVEKIQRRLITHEDPKSPISEAYRSLRTSLMYSHLKQDVGNVILVSSPGPGEGKTTTIVNLAITYANLGKKTILVDCDLRKPVTHKIFNLERDPGITKYLSGNSDNIEEIINNTEVDNLSMITCGIVPPNPSEILASAQMEKLIEKLKGEFDIILIDSPPLLAVTDSFVITKFADQFILVVRAGQTEKGGLDRSLDQMKQVGVNFSGVVMNDVDESNSYGKGYYYNYYQYYYGDS